MTCDTYCKTAAISWGSFRRSIDEINNVDTPGARAKAYSPLLALTEDKREDILNSTHNHFRL